MKAQALETILTQVLKPEYGVPDEKNGLLLGDPEREVTRMGFCWSATVEVLEEAARQGAQALFAHEPWEIPVYRSHWFERPEKFELPANRRRRELHEAHRFAFFQYHSPLDGWPLWSTGRALTEVLGFDPDAAAWPSRFIPIVTLKPQPLRAFATLVRDRLGLLGVGLSGNLDAPVHKALLAVGGLGTSWAISEVARKGGADVMVTGELSDYTVRAAREAGIAVLKASHYSTENPAVRKLAQFMARELEGQVDCRFLDCGESWQPYGAAL